MAKTRWVPALFELYVRGVYMGHVEKAYAGKKPWVAVTWVGDWEQRSASKLGAQRALERRVQPKARKL